jgi:hypothetical protein
MQLRFYRSYWGATNAYAEFAAEARADGYDGLEAAVPLDKSSRHLLQAALADFDCDLIAEIGTAGARLPDRRATPEQHLSDFVRKLEAAAELAPQRINCYAGCDAWPLAESRDFLDTLIGHTARLGIPIGFATTRGRSLCTPWVTRDLVRSLPGLELTCDFSHWCVVCERLLDTELDLLEEIAPRTRHIHARVGYAQGPQVPHPAAPEYAVALVAHQRWWTLCWQAMVAAGLAECALTPAFGADEYLQHIPFIDQPVARPRELNRWMLKVERAHFAHWMAQR